MDQEEATKIFMSEGQCARCGEGPYVYSKEFTQLSGENIILGFCSLKCENAFVKGMDAIKDASRNTTQ